MYKAKKTSFIIFMAKFKGLITWRISARCRAEISARLLKQILLKSNYRLHGEGFSPGHNSARAENPGPVFANQARIFSPAKRATKSEKFSCNRNRISARAEKQKIIWLPLGRRSDFSGIKAIKERIFFIVSLISKLR